MHDNGHAKKKNSGVEAVLLPPWLNKQEEDGSTSGPSTSESLTGLVADPAVHQELVIPVLGTICSNQTSNLMSHFRLMIRGGEVFLQTSRFVS